MLVLPAYRMRILKSRCGPELRTKNPPRNGWIFLFFGPLYINGQAQKIWETGICFTFFRSGENVRKPYNNPLISTKVLTFVGGVPVVPFF